MTEIFLLIFWVIGSSVDSNFILTPDDNAILNPDELQAPCLEEVTKDNVLDWKKGDRLTGFQLNGRYLCQRKIFEYNERDSFVDFVTEHQVSRAQNVAQELKSILGPTEFNLNGNCPYSCQPLTVEVQTDIPELKATIQATFIQEITGALGPKSVGKGSSEKMQYPRLIIRTQRLQDSIDFMSVKLWVMNKRNELQGHKL